MNTLGCLNRKHNFQQFLNVSQAQSIDYEHRLLFPSLPVCPSVMVLCKALIDASFDFFLSYVLQPVSQKQIPLREIRRQNAKKQGKGNEEAQIQK